MNELTYQKLAEMKERESKATPGPWYMAGKWTVLSRRNSGDMVANMSRLDEHEANADFIAHARTDIPILITEIDRQRKEIVELKKFEARCKWLEEHGDPQFIYEEGRPHIGVPIIRIDNWHEGECVADTVSEAVDRAISLTAESEGEK